MKRYLAVILLSLSSLNYANQPQLNKTIVRIINQINATMPLLNEAQNEIEPNARMQLHIEKFIGADGKSHPGLRDDLRSIRSSLIGYINNPAIAPRKIEPLAMDFVRKNP